MAIATKKIMMATNQATSLPGMVPGRPPRVVTHHRNAMKRIARTAAITLIISPVTRVGNSRFSYGREVAKYRAAIRRSRQRGRHEVVNADLKESLSSNCFSISPYMRRSAKPGESLALSSDAVSAWRGGPHLTVDAG